MRKRLRPLALQATAAERAEKLAAEIAGVEAAIAVLDLASLDARRGAARERREQELAARRELDARMEALVAARSAAEDELTDAAGEREAHTAALYALRSGSERLALRREGAAALAARLAAELEAARAFEPARAHEALVGGSRRVLRGPGGHRCQGGRRGGGCGGLGPGRRRGTGTSRRRDRERSRAWPPNGRRMRTRSSAGGPGGFSPCAAQRGGSGSFRSPRRVSAPTPRASLSRPRHERRAGRLPTSSDAPPTRPRAPPALLPATATTSPPAPSSPASAWLPSTARWRSARACLLPRGRWPRAASSSSSRRSRPSPAASAPSLRPSAGWPRASSPATRSAGSSSSGRHRPPASDRSSCSSAAIHVRSSRASPSSSPTGSSTLRFRR